MRFSVDGRCGVVSDVREHPGDVLIYSVLLDDPSSDGPVYGILHEFEIEPAEGPRRRVPLSFDIATFVASRVKRGRGPTS